MKRLASIIIDELEDNNFTVHFRRIDLKDIIFIKDNVSSGSIYWYLDDKYKVYLANIAVSKEERQKGFGNRVLNNLERIAAILEAKEIYLTTERNSIPHKWYERKNYIYVQDNEIIKDFIWLKKII